MKKFHRNLNIMSIFTALLLVLVLIFWRTFFNIAITNVFLNGIIIGTTIFGIGLCFVSIFRLLPEYKWMHAYFDGHANYGFVPRLLRPISSALHNRHVQLSTSSMTELLDMVSIRIEEERDSIRYITNTLIFLGLLGTFWGLIITVGSFAELLINVDFSDETVLQTMQMGMAGPLSGMATAFTSSLLGLAGSLAVGFLGLQLQFAQNTLFTELTDFMSKYVLQTPGDSHANELSERAPVDESTYTKISKMYDALTDAGYQISDLIRINGKHPAIVAIGTNEKLFIATLIDDYEILQNALKRIELCFADTLEGLHIDTHILCMTNRDIDSNDKRILRFTNINAFEKYLKSHKNVRPSTQQDKDNFDAYAEYINTVMTYLFKK
ncbi:MAG: hypothetical protein ACLRFP_04210 [Alphaproteobacteria bacterium]